MAMFGKIRRMYFRDPLSISEIARRTSLSRNTIKRWLAAALVPSRLVWGETFQFDWNEEPLVIGGIHRRLQVAPIKLCASGVSRRGSARYGRGSGNIADTPQKQ